MSLTTEMATDAMLGSVGDAFRSDRRSDQKDTPSTFIFVIAVFDLLLTLLDTSGTAKAHAYETIWFTSFLMAQQNKLQPGEVTCLDVA